MPATLKEFGAELRELINSDEVFALLDQFNAPDWGSGGCWILAEAVKEFLGPPARLMAIATKGVQVDHVVVDYGDVYIDYMGARDKYELLGDFASDFMRENTRLVPLDRRRQRWAVDTWDMPSPHEEKKVVEQLVGFMRERFKP